MTHRYVPKFHDATLTELNQRGLTDREIAAVMEFDFLTIKKYRTLLNLEPALPPRTPHPTVERPPPPPKEKPNPVETASRVLASRLVEKPGSGFWLDDRPASLDTVMRAANAVLKRHGLDQVGVDRWRVE
jgi:hypothetical protein